MSAAECDGLGQADTDDNRKKWHYGKEGQAMDEKERLSGVDAEIQNHAEQDNAQNVPALDFPALALFLAKSYGQMLKDRERLKAVIDAGVAC